MTLIYYTFFTQPLSDALFQELISKLPEDIRDKIFRFRMWEDKHASLFGKLMLKKALVDLGYTGKFILEYSKYARPYLVSNESIDFNISHTKNAVVCIASDDRRVGVDIEEIKRLDLKDFKSQWTSKEWHDIISTSNNFYQFYTYWTRKEAVIKADGRGLSIPLIQIDVRNNVVKVDDVKWYLKTLDLLDNHITHICSNKKFDIKDIKIKEIDFYIANLIAE